MCLSLGVCQMAARGLVGCVVPGAHSSSQRPLACWVRSAMMLAAPWTVQCMPDCLARWTTICLQAASMWPDPVNMPSHIELDVSALGINDSLHVSDLKVPEGVELLIDAEATVCVVSPPHVEEEPVAPEAGVEGEAAAEPELIRKPKAEDEEGAEEEK